MKRYQAKCGKSGSPRLQRRNTYATGSEKNNCTPLYRDDMRNGWDCM